MFLDRAEGLLYELLALDPQAKQAGRVQEQQVLFCWIGGHGTDPKEQNTQQSPGFGFSLSPHPLQS
jgi:hypothetical protein